MLCGHDKSRPVPLGTVRYSFPSLPGAAGPREIATMANRRKKFTEQMIERLRPPPSGRSRNPIGALAYPEAFLEGRYGTSARAGALAVGELDAGGAVLDVEGADVGEVHELAAVDAEEAVALQALLEGV